MNKKFISSIIIGMLIIILVVVMIRAKQQMPFNGSSSGKIQVTTSFYPLYFFAQAIGGDLANVANITPAGAEPHDYEPTARDMAQIENSALLILNGAGLEAWGDNIVKNINQSRTHIVTAGAGLTTQTIEEAGRTNIDPHVWLSPLLAKQMAATITQGFISVDPKHTAEYQINANRLQDQLTKLDAEYVQGLAHCGQNNFVTSHAAFGYLAAAYGLHQVSIAGLSPDAEPSPEQLAGIITLVKHDMIKYIFFESLVSPKLAETIARETGAQTMVLNPLEGLSPAELAQGKDYLTVMRDNLHNLQIVLQCQK